MASKEELLTRINAESATLAATKRAFKAELEKRGLTPTDVFSTYAGLIESLTGGSVTVQDEKTVTFNGVTLEVAPDEGYDGIRKVILAGDPNLKALNIVDAITMYGVTGSAKVAVSEDWPPDLPATEEEMDEDVLEEDAEAPIEDKFVLMDNEGNVTTGYLYTEPDSGLMVYNGRVYPDIASVYTDDVKAEYPYAYICYHLAWWRLILSDTQLCAAHTDLGWNYLSSNGAEITYQAYDWKSADLTPNGWEYVGEYTNALNSSSEILWSNTDVYSVEGALFMAGSAPIEYKGFEITWYDPTTTEFRAVGWRRVSKHTTGEDAGKITKDDFTRTESGGWNYLKNIRMCTREKLYYKGVEVWPTNWPTCDTATYPYGIMWINNTTRVITLAYMEEEAHIRENDQYIGGAIPHVEFSTTENGEWGAGETQLLMSLTIKTRHEDSADAETILWSNYDVRYKSDGALYFAASAPIPV